MGLKVSQNICCFPVALMVKGEKLQVDSGCQLTVQKLIAGFQAGHH